MSKRQAKARTKKKEGIKGKIAKPKGAPPVPIVKVRHSNDIKIREARGFSIGELKQSGLDKGIARRFGLRIDQRRRSVIADNVEALKRWLKPKAVRKRAVKRSVKKGERQAQT